MNHIPDHRPHGFDAAYPGEDENSELFYATQRAYYESRKAKLLLFLEDESYWGRKSPQSRNLRDILYDLFVLG